MKPLQKLSYTISLYSTLISVIAVSHCDLKRQSRSLKSPKSDSNLHIFPNRSIFVFNSFQYQRHVRYIEESPSKNILREKKEKEKNAWSQVTRLVADTINSIVIYFQKKKCWIFTSFLFLNFIFSLKNTQIFLWFSYLWDEGYFVIHTQQ